ncbi:MAG TPA: hypothetical protein VGQ73_09570, partial [Gemmatimonadales bacterium]|nr:hypothetical protein [Gemmatimonadales bacterium]
DLGGNSTLGAVLTTREDGGDHSRLAGLDARIYHSRLYYLELQAAQASTDSGSTHRSGPLLQATWDRTGRAWGFHYSLQAIGPGFQAAAGFVNRTGILSAQTHNRLSFYGRPGALLETWTTFFSLGRLWDYANLRAGPIEGSEGVNPSARLRGGWQLGGGLERSFFSYDPALYAGYSIAPALPFVVPGPEHNQWNGSLTVTTPTYRQFTATASVALGEVPIFREAAPGNSLRLDGSVDLRPTAALRATLQLSRLVIDRRRDGSRFSAETIPRLKLEYQVNRALFLRFVGQYAARSRAPLLDRQGRAILLNGLPDGGNTTNEFRMDWLFSYRPTPGTLLYLGYGSTLEEPEQFRFNQLRRTTDGFFGKVSYLFRM